MCECGREIEGGGGGSSESGVVRGCVKGGGGVKGGLCEGWRESKRGAV